MARSFMTREQRLRLMLSRSLLTREERLKFLFSSSPHVKFTIFTVWLLAGGSVSLLSMVEELKGTFGLLQMLRMVAVAHSFRFLQSILGQNQIPPSFYLRKVLPFYDLPITLAIAAFYTSIWILPKDRVHVTGIFLSLLSFPFVLHKVPPIQASAWNTQPVDKRKLPAPTQASAWNTQPVLQRELPAIFYLILPTMEFFYMKPNDTSDIEAIYHFAIILLTGMCVELVVQVERVRGTYELIRMVLVLEGRHLLYIIQFFRGTNKVPPLYYLRKVLLFYDIPFTATFAVFHGIFGTPSETLILVLIPELSLLAWIHISISRREKLNITQGTEPEQDIRPTQASSSNTEELPSQQNHDAANNAISSPQNHSQREICDAPIGDGGSPSVHDASNRVNGDLSAVVEEEDVAAANSISETTDFSTWERKRIGGGGFGIVDVLRDRETGRSFAVKQLKNCHNKEIRKSLTKEINILSELEHSNIVKYYDHEEVGSRIDLYMEYIEQGSLKQYISKRGVLDEHLIQNFTAQILSGLVYLHNKKVVHRDLKPDNILVDSGDVVKLVDFGLAKKLDESTGKHSVLGTPYYAAPEVLQTMEYKRSCDASAADIWSLGCVIIEMFSGKHPWPGFEPMQVFFKVCLKKEDPTIPVELCSEGQDFLRLCFERILDKRPSAAELLLHDFVKAYTC